MSHWKKLTLEDWPVPRVACCYAVYGDGKLLYVGSTKNLEIRFKAHDINYARYSSWCVCPWGRFKDVYVKYKPSRKWGDWAMIELRLIRRLKPAGNTAHVEGRRRKGGCDAA